MKALVANLSCHTKFELIDVWNHTCINTVNIPNPDCVGVISEHSICITTLEELLLVELTCLNIEKFAAAKVNPCNKNATATATELPKAVYNLPVIYIKTTKAECEYYPTLKKLVNSLPILD